MPWGRTRWRRVAVSWTTLTWTPSGTSMPWSRRRPAGRRPTRRRRYYLPAPLAERNTFIVAAAGHMGELPVGQFALLGPVGQDEVAEVAGVLDHLARRPRRHPDALLLPRRGRVGHQALLEALVRARLAHDLVDLLLRAHRVLPFG